MAVDGNGTAIDLTDAGPYEEGEVIEIEAVPDSGYEFLFWSATAGYFDDINSAVTTFIMPDQDVTVTARFLDFDSEEFVYDTECGEWTPWRTARNAPGIYIDTWDISSIATGAVMDFDFDAYSLPDRWWIYYDGELVLETGWRGSAGYEGDPRFPGGIAGPGRGEALAFMTKIEGVDELVIRTEGGDTGTWWDYRLRCRILD